MKNAIIKIKGKQGLDGQEETIELTTVGTIKQHNGEWQLCYDESELSGMEKTSSVITVRGSETVIMERSGGMATRLVIQSGIRNNCYYSTPHGDLMIGLFGESIENNLTMLGGNLKMSYTLDSNLKPISRNEVEITVKIQ